MSVTTRPGFCDDDDDDGERTKEQRDEICERGWSARKHTHNKFNHQTTLELETWTWKQTWVEGETYLGSTAMIMRFLRKASNIAFKESRTYITPDRDVTAASSKQNRKRRIASRKTERERETGRPVGLRRSGRPSKQRAGVREYSNAYYF
jgi:hypothetical protein